MGKDRVLEVLPYSGKMDDVTVGRKAEEEASKGV